MALAPYWADLPVAGDGRSYVGHTEWDMMMGNFAVATCDRNMANFNIGGIGQLGFGASGYISTPVGLGGVPAANAALDFRGGRVAQFTQPNNAHQFRLGVTANDSVLRLLYDSADNSGAGVMRIDSAGNVTLAGGLTASGNMSVVGTALVEALLADSTLEVGNWTAFRASSAAGATKLLVGITSSASHIQSMAQGTGWTTKPLVLMGNGGQVGVGGLPVGAARLTVAGDLNVSHLLFSSIRSAASATDSAAQAAGCAIGEVYRVSNALYIRLT